MIAWPLGKPESPTTLLVAVARTPGRNEAQDNAHEQAGEEVRREGWGCVSPRCTLPTCSGPSRTAGSRRDHGYYLAVIYLFTKGGYLAPRIVNIALGLAGVVLVFLLGRSVYGRSVGLIAAFLVATYWVFIFWEGEVNDPSLFVFLVPLLMHWLRRWAGTMTFRRAALVGVTTGCLCPDAAQHPPVRPGDGCADAVGGVAARAAAGRGPVVVRPGSVYVRRDRPRDHPQLRRVRRRVRAHLDLLRREPPYREQRGVRRRHPVAPLSTGTRGDRHAVGVGLRQRGPGPWQGTGHRGHHPLGGVAPVHAQGRGLHQDPQAAHAEDDGEEGRALLDPRRDHLQQGRPIREGVVPAAEVPTRQ